MIYLLQGFKYSRENLPSRFSTGNKMSFSERRLWKAVERARSSSDPILLTVYCTK